MADLTKTVNQFTARYRTAILKKTGVWSILCLSILAAIIWRFSATKLGTAWQLGVPIAIGIIAAGAICAWIRKQWISSSAAAARLDRKFNLKERLVTAEEFGHMDPKPALYSLLEEDTTHRISPEHIKLPRTLDRVAGVLAVILLLLLLWPRTGLTPTQYAQSQDDSAMPSKQQMFPPDQSNPQGDGSSEQGAGGIEGMDQQASQGDSSAQEGRGGQSQADANGGNGSNDSTSEDQSDFGAESANSDKDGKGRDSLGNENAQSRDLADSKEDANQNSQRSASGSQDADSTESRKASADSASGGTQSKEQIARNAKAQASREEQGGGGGQQADAGQRERGAASSGGTPGSNQATLKAEIKELLREVSAELKTLQEQLATEEIPHPNPGTSTDPDLYGESVDLNTADGAIVPIQLGTDTVPTQAKRPQSGVGEPSGEVSESEPKMQSADVMLAGHSLEEIPMSRQPIPPEYRSVFNRLSQRRSQPNEEIP